MTHNRYICVKFA